MKISGIYRKKKRGFVSMKKFTRLLALVLALCLMLPLFALAEDAPAATDVPVAEDPVFFTLNGQDYLKSDVDSLLYYLYSNGYVESMTDYTTAMQFLIEDAVLNAKIDELGLNQFTADEEAAFLSEAQAEWENQVNAYVQYFLSEDTDEARAKAREDGEAYLNAYGMSVESIVENLKVSASSERLFEYVTKDIPAATDEEIKAVFEEYAGNHKDMFAEDFPTYEWYVKNGYAIWYKPEGFRGILHILLQVDQELLNAYTTAQALYEESLSGEEAAEGEEAVTKEDVDTALQAVLDSQKAAIDDIYARLEKGEAFQTLIAQYNTDPGMAGVNLENGYEVHAESTMTWIPEFVAGAFSEKMQKPGDVSDPVVASYGIHILYYLRDIPGGIVEMDDEIKTMITDYLNNDKQMGAYYEQIDAWVSEFEVVYNVEAIAAVGADLPFAEAETEAE
ncbi:MAG: hypothetical protein E7336_08935 [Clostridiales bacterium]|nr:hypothetical protein [Clostridiales bacterium]